MPTSFCAQPGPLLGQYEVKLAACKPDQSFVTTYSDTGKTASLTPVRTDLPPVPMVEKITWSLVSGAQLKISYDDTVPYSDPKLMLACKVDPRNLAVDEFTLKALYDTVAESGLVLPGVETSCLITSTINSQAGNYVAFVYSSIDGFRNGG